MRTPRSSSHCSLRLSDLPQRRTVPRCSWCTTPRPPASTCRADSSRRWRLPSPADTRTPRSNSHCSLPSTALARRRTVPRCSWCTHHLLSRSTDQRDIQSPWSWWTPPDKRIQLSSSRCTLPWSYQQHRRTDRRDTALCTMPLSDLVSTRTVPLRSRCTHQRLPSSTCPSRIALPWRWWTLPRSSTPRRTRPSTTTTTDPTTPHIDPRDTPPCMQSCSGWHSRRTDPRCSWCTTPHLPASTCRADSSQRWR